MDNSQQDLLRKAWTGGRTGYLSALSEAKAWALREVWRAEGRGDWGMTSFVAQRVQKIGGGKPGQPAISKFFQKVDSDSHQLVQSSCSWQGIDYQSQLQALFDVEMGTCANLSNLDGVVRSPGSEPVQIG